MYLDRGLADVEAARDELVGAPERKRLQDLLFAIGQCGSVALFRRGLLADRVYQPGVQALVDRGAAVERLVDRGEQVLRLHVLEQVAVGAAADRRDQVVGVVRHGEHDHPAVQARGADRLERLDAAHARHVQVEQDQVRVELLRHRHALLAVGGLAHHVQVRGQGDQLGDALAEQGVVVDDQDAVALAHPATCLLLMSPPP